MKTVKFLPDFREEDLAAKSRQADGKMAFIIGREIGKVGLHPGMRVQKLAGIKYHAVAGRRQMERWPAAEKFHIVFFLQPLNMSAQGLL